MVFKDQFSQKSFLIILTVYLIYYLTLIDLCKKSTKLDGFHHGPFGFDRKDI